MRINVEIKVCHVFGTGRPMNFKLGTQISPTSAMSCKVKGQGYMVHLTGDGRLGP